MNVEDFSKRQPQTVSGHINELMDETIEKETSNNFRVAKLALLVIVKDLEKLIKDEDDDKSIQEAKLLEVANSFGVIFRQIKYGNEGLTKFKKVNNIRSIEKDKKTVYEQLNSIANNKAYLNLLENISIKIKGGDIVKQLLELVKDSRKTLSFNPEVVKEAHEKGSKKNQEVAEINPEDVDLDSGILIPTQEPLESFSRSKKEIEKRKKWKELKNEINRIESDIEDYASSLDGMDKEVPETLKDKVKSIFESSERFQNELDGNNNGKINSFTQQIRAELFQIFRGKILENITKTETNPKIVDAYIKKIGEKWDIFLNTFKTTRVTKAS
jgi:hypothetical protein